MVRIKHKAGFYFIGEDGQNFKAWPLNTVFQFIIGNTIGKRPDGLDCDLLAVEARSDFFLVGWEAMNF